MDKILKHLKESWSLIENGSDTIELTIPVSLSEEAKMAIEDTWDQSVVSEKINGKLLVINIKKEVIDTFLQGLLSVVDNALGEKGVPLKDLNSWERKSRTKAKSWIKVVAPLIRKIIRENPDISFRMTYRYLQWM